MRDWAHSRRLGTPADEAGSVVLRQPPASKLATLFRIDVRDHAFAGMVQKRVTAQGGWGRRPKGDDPRSEASALGARWRMPARPQPPGRSRRCQPRFRGAGERVTPSAQPLPRANTGAANYIVVTTWSVFCLFERRVSRIGLDNLRFICSDMIPNSRPYQNFCPSSWRFVCLNSPRFLDISRQFTVHLLRQWIPSSSRGIGGGPRRSWGVGRYLTPSQIHWPPATGHCSLAARHSPRHLPPATRRGGQGNVTALSVDRRGLPRLTRLCHNPQSLFSER